MSITRLTAVIFLCACSTAQVNASTWMYVNPLDPKGNMIAISNSPRTITLNSHRAFEWYSCENKGLKCLLSGVISFAVPETIAKISAWEIEKVKYKIVKSADLTIFGVDAINTHLIEATFLQNNDLKQYFLYSQEKGLLAISEKMDGSSGYLLLQGKCGFGASKNCK